jgi:hypothetical protein
MQKQQMAIRKHQRHMKVITAAPNELSLQTAGEQGSLATLRAAKVEQKHDQTYHKIGPT